MTSAIAANTARYAPTSRPVPAIARLCGLATKVSRRDGTGTPSGSTVTICSPITRAARAAIGAVAAHTKSSRPVCRFSAVASSSSDVEIIATNPASMSSANSAAAMNARAPKLTNISGGSSSSELLRAPRREGRKSSELSKSKVDAAIIRRSGGSSRAGGRMRRIRTPSPASATARRCTAAASVRRRSGSTTSAMCIQPPVVQRRATFQREYAQVCEWLNQQVPNTWTRCTPRRHHARAEWWCRANW